MREKFLYSLTLFVFTLANAFVLNWASNIFFKPISLTLEYAVQSTLAGSVMALSISLVYLCRDIISSKETDEHDESFRKLNEHFRYFKQKSLGRNAEQYDIGMAELKDLELFERSKIMGKRAVLFLICYIIVIPYIELGSLSAELVRTSFSNLISAAGFGFVIYTMLAET